MKIESLAVLGSTVFLLSGCAAGEWTGPAPAPVRAPRDVYASSVGDGARLRAWEDASRRALRSGLRVTPSFRERVRFPSSEPHAVAYRFPLVRGQTLRIRVDALDGGDVFTDVFRYMGGDIYRPAQPARRIGDDLTFTAHADGEYVLRVQPRIGAGGTYDIAVIGAAGIAFPVAGGSTSDIGGVFGDPRDGGVRAHEGVDIFAPRGTEVLAVADGRIEKARNTPTGGLVIWQVDASSGLRYYYAHLDELIAREGQYARAGDVIGRVGNTGNARGTRPHLHFGIYRPGTIAIDPVPMLVARAKAPTETVITGRTLGSRTRPASNGVRLRAEPSVEGEVIAQLSTDTPVLVIGDMGDWQRVVLPDGTSGFVAAGLTEPAMAGSRAP